MSETGQTITTAAAAPPADGAANAGGGPPVFFSGKAVSGVPWMIFSKAILVVVYFALSVVVVRSLGREKYGVFTLVKTLADYLLVFCGLGLNASLVRFIPELAARRHLAGIQNLLWKTALLQVVMVGLTTALLVAWRPFLDRWFHVDFGWCLPLGALLIAGQLSKDYFNDSFTALFQSRTVSLLAIGHGFLWLGTAWVLVTLWPSPISPVLAQGGTMLAVSGLSAVVLWRLLKRLAWRSPGWGIGRERVFKLSGATLLSAMFRTLMQKYTEVFFLGACFSPAVVGLYDLGYSTPQIAITLIPAALQTLMASAFAEAYTRDPNCLPRLIQAAYKTLILMAVPLAAFGVCFAPRGIVLIYGAEMAAAVWVASCFCVLHLLPLISMPLAMAIVVKEKVIVTLPMLVLQVGVNLLLDWLLIPRFGMGGAVAAVALTFFLTIPVRLVVVRRVIGGIWFPTRFMMRVAVPTTLLAFVLLPLASRLNVAALLFLAAFYLGAYVLLVKHLRLLQPEDVADLRRLELGKLNRVLTWLVPRPG
jgi:O-antigen/teichoic acid export membrane protein